MELPCDREIWAQHFSKFKLKSHPYCSEKRIPARPVILCKKILAKIITRLFSLLNYKTHHRMHSLLSLTNLLTRTAGFFGITLWLRNLSPTFLKIWVEKSPLLFWKEDTSQASNLMQNIFAMIITRLFSLLNYKTHHCMHSLTIEDY